MKNIAVFVIFLQLLILGNQTTNGQTFPLLFEIKSSISPNKIYGLSSDGNLYIVSNDKEIIAYKTDDGSLSWNYNFLDKFGTKEFKWQFWNKKNNVIMLGNSDEKNAKIFIDDKTGIELWRKISINKFKDYKFEEVYLACFIDSIKGFPVFEDSKINMLNIRDGKTIWSYDPLFTASDKNFNITVSDMVLNIKRGSSSLNPRFIYLNAVTGQFIDTNIVLKGYPKGIKIKQFEQPVMIQDKKAVLQLRYQDVENSYSGDDREMSLLARDFDTYQILWQADFKTTVIGSVIGSVDQIDMKLINNYFLVISESIHAFDITTGKKLWEIPFVRTESNAFPKKEIYTGVSTFLIDFPFIYVTDIKSDCIKKINITSGTEIWQTKFKNKSEIYPDLQLDNGFLVLQSGGKMPYESELKSSMPIGGFGIAGAIMSIGLSYTRTYLQKVKKFKGVNHGIYILNPDSGNIMWMAQPLSRISNTIIYNKNIYVGDKSTIICWSLEKGQKRFSIDLEQNKLKNIYNLDLDSTAKKLWIHTENGLAVLNLIDDKIIYYVNTDDNKNYFKKGEKFFIVVDSDDMMNIKELIYLDVINGSIMGKMSLKNQFSDPSEFLTPDGGKIVQFNTTNRKLSVYSIKN
jgi:outer membrane protein assembly factor BamB